MKFCVQCCRVMTCQKNGAVVEFANGHGYMADVFACEKCRFRVAISGTNQGVIKVTDAVRDGFGGWIFQARES